MKTFFRLLKFSKPYHHYIPEYIVYIFLFIVFGLLNFALLVPLFDELFQTGKSPLVTVLPKFTMTADYFKSLFYYYLHHAVMVYPKMGVLIYVCMIVLLAVLLKNIFGYLSQRVLTRMRVNLVRKMREKLFEQYSRQSLQFYQNEKKGDLLSTISSDVVEIENSVVSSIQTIFREPLLIISTFIMLFYFSARLTLFTIIFFPVSGILISWISKRLKRKSKESQRLLGMILNLSEEAISGIRVIKSFNAENFVTKRFRKINDQFTKVTKSIVNQRELASPLSEFLGVAAIIIVIIYGGYLILTNKSNLTASAFLAYIAFYYQVITPVKNTAGAITYLQRGLAAGERVIRIIDSPETIKERPDPLPIKSFQKSIEFKNVNFRYKEDNVLRNINLVIPKGKMIALVGNSGGGKSTLTDLVSRFYDVNEGAILIDDIDIRDLKIRDLRKQISVVSQEAILFNDTIYNNIAFGIENANKDDVIQAAKIANAYDFIMQMDNGFETSIGDRGLRLSGGQRQRITIARAVLKNAPILILDEATSALDSESEKLVQQALEGLMQNRTSIVIAHRLSTIRFADEIIVLQQGEIVERGNHEQLIAHDGVYKRLVEMQEFK